MQRGAVLAAELRNNGFKLAKWTTCAILAGSDHMKFGYVSRQNFKDASRHIILGMQNFKPQEFATQMASHKLTTIPESLETVRIKSLPSSAFYISEFITQEEERLLLEKVRFPDRCSSFETIY